MKWHEWTAVVLIGLIAGLMVAYFARRHADVVQCETSGGAPVVDCGPRHWPSRVMCDLRCDMPGKEGT